MRQQTAQAPSSVSSSAGVRLSRLGAQANAPTAGCRARRHLAGHGWALGRKPRYSRIPHGRPVPTHHASSNPINSQRRSRSSIGSSSSSQAGRYEYWADSSQQPEPQQHQGWSSWRSVVQTGVAYQAWCFMARKLEDAAVALWESSPRAINLSFQQAELVVKAGAALLTLLVVKSIASLLWNVLLIGIVGYVALRISARSRRQDDLSSSFPGGTRDADSGGGGVNGPRSDLVDVWFVQPSDDPVREGSGGSRGAPQQPSAAPFNNPRMRPGYKNG